MKNSTWPKRPSEPRTWLAGLTHNGAYHGKPNDQEFWAEWRSKQLIDPATKRLKAGLFCDEDKDWANPGLQTKK
ncbi:MAG: hypothetical protein L6Q97_19210 [Thermoanaerobaculia bacterium]|nr:hypothetical protein [Thermoanaerobaculia bacterium]